MTWNDTARVIDCSHWQPPDDMDWASAINAGCVGAIIKCSQGTSGVDPAASQHARKVRAAGVSIIGGYHFGDGSDPKQQATHFLGVMRAVFGLDLSGLIVMLDAEQNTASQMSVAQAEIFVQTVHDALGRWPLLYMGHFGPTGNGAGLPSRILSNCPLMLPAYGNHANDLGTILPKGFRLPKDGADRGEPGTGVVRLWQFTDGDKNGGPFPGLGKVDQSRLIGLGSIDEARAALMGDGVAAEPAPAPAPQPDSDQITPLIRALQAQLGVSVDGVWGPKSQAALMAWQRAA